MRQAGDGATVVVNGRADRTAVEAVAEEITAKGGKALSYIADVSATHCPEGWLGRADACTRSWPALHRVRCNCVAPGPIDTLRGASAGAMPATLVDGGVPLGRKESVEEMAAVVRMQVGPEAGDVTGQTVHVNGGAFLT